MDQLDNELEQQMQRMEARIRKEVGLFSNREHYLQLPAGHVYLMIGLSWINTRTPTGRGGEM